MCKLKPKSVCFNRAGFKVKIITVVTALTYKIYTPNNRILPYFLHQHTLTSSNERLTVIYESRTVHYHYSVWCSTNTGLYNTLHIVVYTIYETTLLMTVTAGIGGLKREMRTRILPASVRPPTISVRKKYT